MKEETPLLQTKPKAAIYFNDNKKLRNGCELEYIIIFPTQNEKILKNVKIQILDENKNLYFIWPIYTWYNCSVRLLYKAVSHLNI